ncbi:DUF4350 domain-containing protein [Streptomyces sp. ODS28]|uniref:DUF4350 domain-containing protein n=1 Tax=Streptomyces sp. ODS28 TaxID=3136688 RepID=UPI0031E528D0
MTTSTGTSLSPTGRQLWLRVRGFLLAAAVLAIAGVIVAAIRSGGDHGALDPRSPDPTGSRAIAQLLAQRGVDTKVVTSAREAAAAAGRDSTLLVANPDAAGSDQRKQLREAAGRGARTVLLAPGPHSVGSLAPGVRADKPSDVQPTAPDCDFPAATRAGNADLGGYRYTTGGSDARKDSLDTCYLRGELPTLMRLPTGTSGGDTVLLGAPDLLHNKQLDKHGNASLALQLLGSRPHLVWYLPSPADASAGDGNDNRSFFSLLPDGWSWGALQLAIAAVLAALWRARRLGPLVTEQLPVSVRASETTEGRARLYRKANARDRAAESLRTAARSRLAPLVGVAQHRADDPEVLVPAITSYAPPRQSTATGAPAQSPQTPSDTAPVRSLLFGPAPTDDEALIRLADELDQLERRVTSTATTNPAPTSPAPPTDKDNTR